MKVHSCDSFEADWSCSNGLFTFWEQRVAENIPKEIPSTPRWICLKLEGPFPFSQTGVLLSFIAPLSNYNIPIFAISTFDTDYVLIPQQHAGRALDLLRKAGHELLRETTINA